MSETIDVVTSPPLQEAKSAETTLSITVKNKGLDYQIGKAKGRGSYDAHIAGEFKFHYEMGESFTGTIPGECGRSELQITPTEIVLDLRASNGAMSVYTTAHGLFDIAGTSPGRW